MTRTTTGPDWLEARTHAALDRVRRARESHVYPFFREFERGGLRTTVGGHPIVNFSSNDYLGLTTHPAVLAAGHAAVDRYALGLSSSRLQANTIEHAALERRLAAFFGFERALITTTGYQAVVSAITALADQDVALVLDSLAHASILDAASAAAGVPGRGAQLRFFNHNSPRSLERVLSTLERPRAIVAVEGLYSLDGDLGSLAEIADVCERRDAALLVDDAHGSGTLGDHGRGTLEHLGLEGRVPLVVTTFSKAFGGIGGVILGSADVIDFVQHTARAFLFSAALPVPVVAAAGVILDMLEADGPALVGELQRKARYLRGRLTDAGFDLGASVAHVMPVMVRDESAVFALHQMLYRRGLYLVPITYPAVKRGEERLRLNVTRGHSDDDLEALVDALVDSYAEVGAGRSSRAENSPFS